MKRPLLAATAVAAGLACLAAVYLLRDYWRFRFPDIESYPVRGVDVSHHQGAVAWPRVAGQGIRFAYIKATEGGDFQDHEFRRNWEGAASNSIARGAYHFFSLCKPGEEQARNFIAAVPLEPGTLPPAVDFEFVGNCRARPPREEVLREFFAFTDALEARFGARPVIYATAASYDRYLKGKVGAYRLWMRGVFFKPRLSDGHPWSLWQYTGFGRLDGVKGAVDLSVFNGSLPEFMRAFPGAMGSAMREAPPHRSWSARK